MPVDTRAAFTPEQCIWLKNKYPDLDIMVQPSPIRCFTDKEFLAEGIEVKEDVSSADWFIGIKEVPIKMLVPNKKYLFFSHTIKKQPHNKKLLQEY